MILNATFNGVGFGKIASMWISRCRSLAFDIFPGLRFYFLFFIFVFSYSPIFIFIFIFLIFIYSYFLYYYFYFYFYFVFISPPAFFLQNLPRVNDLIISSSVYTKNQQQNARGV